MSKDYKTPNKRSSESKSGGGSLLIGILIGLVLGLGIALAVAWYINKMPTPFLTRAPAKADAQKSDVAKSDKSTLTPDSKPRFDFYKILPGAEEAITDQQLKDTQQKPPADQGKDVFYLQAGAFQSAPEADNLKARLALLGLETTIQTTATSDQGTWHRVRVGPFTTVDDLNRARDGLKQNGIATTLIKVHTAAAPAQ